MSFLGSIGNAVKGGVKKVGGLAEKAAPFAGLIPGVGTLAGGALGGLGALAHGDGLSGALKYGAEGAASGFGGGLLKDTEAGSSFLGNVGNAVKSGASKIGSSLKDSFTNPDGSINLGKIISAGGVGMNMIGQARQRNSAQNYNNSQIDQRNSLMSNILAPQNFTLPQITPAGPGVTPGAQPIKPNPGAGASPALARSPNLNQQSSAS